MQETIPQQGFLDVGQGHQIFYQIHGPDDGIPFVFLHGGPGSGFSQKRLALFAGKPIRLIACDQRGCGQSTPTGISPENTTQNLIDDIEKLRQFLNIPQWFVCGNSWGSTLALLYAIHYPQSCLGLVLASLFLGRPQDQDWTFEAGPTLYPDLFNQVSDGLPTDISFERAIYERLLTGTPEEKYDAAYRFYMLGTPLCSLTPDYPTRDSITDQSVTGATLLLYYAFKGFFISDNFILDHAAILKDLPIWLVHGKYDMDCRYEQALELQQILPHIQLQIVDGAHVVTEEPMASTFNGIIADAVAYAFHHLGFKPPVSV
ncbi:MAG TPA: alpha/beta fold hydrolase [Alphaproteobacteria bacterium]